MTTAPTNHLSSGDAGRYIKPSYVEDNSILPSAFDKRLNREVPEEYVSFFLSAGSSEEGKFLDVLEKSQARLTIKNSGYVCLISMEAALHLINNGKKLIWFSDEKLPHIGLWFADDASDQEILETKTLLSWLASQRFQPISQIRKSLTVNYLGLKAES